MNEELDERMYCSNCQRPMELTDITGFFGGDQWICDTCHNIHHTDHEILRMRDRWAYAAMAGDASARRRLGYEYPVTTIADLNYITVAIGRELGRDYIAAQALEAIEER